MSLQNAPIMVGSQVEQPIVEVNSTCSQADHTLYSADKAVYQYVQQFANNVGSSVTLNQTSTSQVIWNLSGDTVWNFGRSYLTFQLNVAAPTTFGCVSADTIPIDSFLLQTVGGSQIATMYNFVPYSKVVPALTTDLKNYLTQGAAYGAATVAGNFYSENIFLQPINCLSTQAGAAGGAVSASYIYASNATPPVTLGSATTGGLTVNSGVDKSYMSRQRIIQSGNTGTAMTILCRIPFSRFVGTVLAVDKDILFGQNLQLVVNFAPIQYTIFNNNAIIQDAAAATTTALTTAVTLTNLYLWCAKQLNSNIVNSFRQKLASSGYSVNIPFTYSGRNVSAVAGLYSASQVLSNGMGKCLKRVINIVQMNSADAALQVDINNVNGSLYTTVQSYLDSNPIQQARLNCGTDIQDFQYLQPLLDNTPLALSVREFQLGGCWIDSFSSSLENGSQILENDCVDDGLKLNESSKLYNLQITVNRATGCIVNQYLTWLRTLMISPSGLYWQ